MPLAFLPPAMKEGGVEGKSQWKETTHFIACGYNILRLHLLGRAAWVRQQMPPGALEGPEQVNPMNLMLSYLWLCTLGLVFILGVLEGLSIVPPCLPIKYKGVHNYTVRNVFLWLKPWLSLKIHLGLGVRGDRIWSPSHFSKNSFTRGSLEQ